MDDYFFKNHVKACRNVIEDTSYLEIFNYSVCDCLTNSPRLASPRTGMEGTGLTTSGPIL